MMLVIAESVDVKDKLFGFTWHLKSTIDLSSKPQFQLRGLTEEERALADGKMTKTMKILSLSPL